MKNNKENKEIAKQVFKELEEEERQQQINDLKLIVKKTLEKLEKKKEAKAELDKEIKILKNDLNDLKEGRLDKIKERQDIDKKAKEVSVIIIKEKIIQKDPPIPVWKTPYTWVWNNSICDNFIGYSTANLTYTADNCTTHLLSCNVAKNNTGGTYKLDNDEIKYL